MDDHRVGYREDLGGDLGDGGVGGGDHEDVHTLGRSREVVAAPKDVPDVTSGVGEGGRQ